MKAVINLTQKHIDNGTPSHGGKCPIALAINDVFPYVKVTVGKTSIWINHKDQPFTVELRRFRISFDNYKPVRPFRFEVEV